MSEASLFFHHTAFHKEKEKEKKKKKKADISKKIKNRPCGKN